MKVSKSKPRAVWSFVAICTLVYLYQWLAAPPWFDGEFALSVAGVQAGYWWQFITYAFLHAGPLHLFLNMVGLWMVGRLVEPAIGSGRFVLLYLFSAVAGGLLQIVIGPENILLGASAAVCGVIAAFSAIFAEQEVLVLLFFVLPMRLRAKYLGWAVVWISLGCQIFHIQTWIGHGAHLGGAVAGYFFTRLSGFAGPSRLERWFFPKAR